MHSKGQNKYTIIYWAVIFLILLLPIIAIGDKLGLYFDAVLPDYIAVQLLHPQEYQCMCFFSFPYLCSPYHGSNDIWLTMIQMLITDSTGAIEHNMIYVTEELIALFVLYKILECNKVDSKVSKCVIFCSAFLPTLTTVAITKFNIELSGIIFMLFAVLTYEKAELIEDKRKQRHTFFLTFFLTGFAVYSYINFLFYFIAIILFFLFDKKYDISFGRKILISFYGLISGGVLYFSAYFCLAVEMLFGKRLWITYSGVLVIVAIWALAFVIIVLIDKNKDKIAYLITLALMIVGFGCFVILLNMFIELLQRLNFKGYSAGIFERIGTAFVYYYEVITGLCEEKLPLREQVTVYWGFLIGLIVIIILLDLIIACINKQIKETKALKYTAVVLIYILATVPFVTRMQTQHFIPLVFMTIYIICLSVNDIKEYIQKRNLKRIGMVTFAIVGVVTSVFLMINRYKLVDKLIETGGYFYYTKQINVLADKALENKEKGEKEIYLFPDWGIWTGFEYLTANRIPFLDSVSEDLIIKLLDEGYEVNLVFYYQEYNDYGNEYMQFVDDDIIDSKTESYYDYDGNIVFNDIILNYKEK